MCTKNMNLPVASLILCWVKNVLYCEYVRECHQLTFKPVTRYLSYVKLLFQVHLFGPYQLESSLIWRGKVFCWASELHFFDKKKLQNRQWLRFLILRKLRRNIYFGAKPKKLISMTASATFWGRNENHFNFISFNSGSIRD